MQMDFNCDMGEGLLTDDLVMPYISSANIACGYHAGGEAVMRATIALSMKHRVKIGAHPSFRDKANFGRKEQHIPPDEVYTLIIQQLVKIDLLVREQGAQLYHVKPHGALYNMAARDLDMATAIATAVTDFHNDLVVYGLSGSRLIEACQLAGLQTFNEAFADRRYQDDGSLVPRSQPDALITSVPESVAQVRQIIENGTVTSVSGKVIPVTAQTICIHGDGRQAPQLARALSQHFRTTAART